jgi:hypothetical protein
MALWSAREEYLNNPTTTALLFITGNCAYVSPMAGKLSPRTGSSPSNIRHALRKYSGVKMKMITIVKAIEGDGNSSRSRWPGGLTSHETSSPVRTLGSCVRIPLKALCPSAFILYLRGSACR